jgi:nitrogen fixation/metabolism regulation signal transduction histidine kinase
VFFNLIDNAYDAMMQSKVWNFKEKDFTADDSYQSQSGGDQWTSELLSLRIMGLEYRSRIRKRFLPRFLPPSLSSKKGTGLGLYVIQRLIEENHKREGCL